MRCPALLILMVIHVAYLIAGGFIFWALESPTEKQQKQQQIAFNLSHIIENLTASVTCLSGDDLRRFADWVLEAERNGLVQGKESSDWDIHGSIFFAMTVVTTIGYGTVTPATDEGQIFCCFFAILGIPFTMVMIVGIGDRFKVLSKKMECKFCCRNRPRLNKFMNTAVIVTAGFGLFLVIPAAVFSCLEGWDYGSAIYYGIITTTTVGFGDFVAAWNCVGDPCWVYRISVGIWIYLGLAWLAGVIGSLQEAIQSLILKVDPKSKKVPLGNEAKPGGNGVAGTELTEGDDTTTVQVTSVHPIDSETQHESERL